jgi:poly(ADP-ribose) glycohydrolase ARH3
MNRSCLVVGRVLMERGMTAEQAIERVRQRRSGSLSDEYAEWLRSEEEARQPKADPATATLRSRYRGAILGAAIGDALGAQYEGTARLLPEEIQYLLTDPHDLRYTDDTAMTIALAESLIAFGGFDPDHMASTFADAFWAEPGRGYAGGPPAMFEEMRKGRTWREASRSEYEGGSFGNGGAMRVTPAALFAAWISTRSPPWPEERPRSRTRIRSGWRERNFRRSPSPSHSRAIRTSRSIPPRSWKRCWAEFNRMRSDPRCGRSPT